MGGGDGGCWWIEWGCWFLTGFARRGLDMALGWQVWISGEKVGIAGDYDGGLVLRVGDGHYFLVWICLFGRHGIRGGGIDLMAPGRCGLRNECIFCVDWAAWDVFYCWWG